MPRKKKPFINKKTDNVRTFSLIPKTDAAADDPEARKKLQSNYGVEFDDDYNYLQHMRNVGEISDGTTIIRYGKTAAENLLEMVHCGKASALVLPPEEVEIEEDKEESDPEIKEVLAALDDDQAIDEDLSEDLIDQLNTSPSDANEQKLPKTSKITSKSDDEDFNWEDDSEDMDEEDECGDEEEDDDDTDADDKGHHRSTEDVRSNNSDVTDASLATVTRRCGQLGILDEGFEKYLERKALNVDDEDSDDFEENAEHNSKILRQIQEEKEAKKNDTVLMKDFVEKPVDRDRILNRYEYDSSGEEEMEEHVEEVDPMAGWDCESFIHSQPSTKKFAPTVIDILPAKPKKVKGLKESENGLEPTSSMQKASIRRLQKAALEHQKPVAILRNKDETEEEKKERKQRVKEQRRERREVKSQNKTLWQQARYRNKLELVRTDQAHLGTRTE